MRTSILCICCAAVLGASAVVAAEPAPADPQPADPQPADPAQPPAQNPAPDPARPPVQPPAQAAAPAVAPPIANGSLSEADPNEAAAHSEDPFAWADWTWLTGNPRTPDNPLKWGPFTGEFRADTAFHYSLNHPVDDSIGGSTEVFRHAEFQVTQLGIGGDFSHAGVQGRLSLTIDLGCEFGGGVSCFGGDAAAPSQFFAGFMAYTRFEWANYKWGATLGGGAINNPGRYLVLVPPINGATAFSGAAPFYTANPGDPSRPGIPS